MTHESNLMISYTGDSVEYWDGRSQMVILSGWNACIFRL
jgi:hypothetical protein